MEPYPIKHQRRDNNREHNRNKSKSQKTLKHNLKTEV